MKDTVRDKLQSFPHEPGVYLFKDSSGNILYVGKARDLRKRMASYVAGRDDRFLIGRMLGDIDDADFIATAGEREALVLENTLIKKHRPAGNIDLKDDKDFYSIMIDHAHPSPGIRFVRRPDRTRNARFFGPYTSSKDMKDVVRFMTAVFPVRTCTDSFFKTRKRPCIRYEIERCLGPCCRKVEPDVYLETVRQFESFLGGKDTPVISSMKKEIKELSDRQEFEKASGVYKRLQALEGMFEKQSAVLGSREDIDACGAAFSGENRALLVQVLHVRGGVLVSQEKRFFSNASGEESDMLEAVLYNYYKDNPFTPDEVLVPRDMASGALAEELSRIHGRKIEVSSPSRGKKKELADMAEKNAELKLKEEMDARNRRARLRELMKKKFTLSRDPQVIECFDISTIQGTDSVASKVRYRNFEKETSGYRRYSLTDIIENDDYVKMAAVVARRLEKSREEGGAPDLIVLDGGYGHLQAVLRALDKAKVPLVPDIIAIAKDKLHVGDKKDKIFVPGRRNPVVFQSFERDVLYAVMKIRDEAHRFAVQYHRLKRKKRYFGEKK
jgi:excinuclease ABC subunit C